MPSHRTAQRKQTHVIPGQVVQGKSKICVLFFKGLSRVPDQQEKGAVQSECDTAQALGGDNV